MFGNQKMYKRGLEDALKANADFSEKQTEALNKLREDVAAGRIRFEDGLGRLEEYTYGIGKLLTDMEKAALYGASSTMDLKELNEMERQLLAAILVELADYEGEANENQQAFIRSIKRYLEITDVKWFNDIKGVISNLESLNVTKALLRVASEFLYLRDDDEINERQEALLSNFNISDKQAEQIEQGVARLYNAIGTKGIAEKYGYVPEEEETTDGWDEEEPTTQSEQQPAATEEVSITETLQVSAGEKKEYRNKIIHMLADIEGSGELKFKACVIHFGENNATGTIRLSKGSSLSMEQCTVECHSMIGKSGETGNEQQFFVTYDGENGASKISFDRCEFNYCGGFLEMAPSTNLMMVCCKINNPRPPFLKQNVDPQSISGLCKILNCEMMFNEINAGKENKCEFFCGNIHISDSKACGICDITEEEKDQDEERKNVLLCKGSGQNLQVENCSFYRLSNVIRSATNVRLSVFEHCQQCIYDTQKIEDCRFDYCTYALSSIDKIENCQFNNCSQQAISGNTTGGTFIWKCDFNNWNGISPMISLYGFDKDFCELNTVNNCTIVGAKAGKYPIISSHISSKLKSSQMVSEIGNCKFINCTRRGNGELINRVDQYESLFGKKDSSGLLRLKDQTVATIVNCDMSEVSGREEREIVLKTESAMGEKLGAYSLLEGEIIGCMVR